MENNRLKRVMALGQSFWLDYIRRDLIKGGELERLIRDDDLRGMTSNPAIFEQAIVDSDTYDTDIRGMAGRSTQAIYETLSQRDVGDAADLFRRVYEATEGLDGYVSLEVNPNLARDTQGTLEEARRLWAALARPNILIKVPATAEGLPAIRQLLEEGINVNVTLLFGVPRYHEVAQAYLEALEARLAAGKALRPVASVASVFVSRIDVLVDPMLASLTAKGGREGASAKELAGTIAIANSKLAYQDFLETFGSDRFRPLRAAGARVQRLLWASTGTKNPAYRDTKYVEALIGPDTVDTLPRATLEAFRDHGTAMVALDQGIPDARERLATFAELGFDLDALTRQLEEEGVEKFKQPFAKLLEALTQRAAPSSTPSPAAKG